MVRNHDLLPTNKQRDRQQAKEEGGSERGID